MKKFILALALAGMMLFAGNALAGGCPPGHAWKGSPHWKCMPVAPPPSEGSSITNEINNTNENSNKNTNMNTNLNTNMNTNVNSNKNENTNKNTNKNSNTNVQGQGQGQGQAQGQGQSQLSNWSQTYINERPFITAKDAAKSPEHADIKTLKDEDAWAVYVADIMKFKPLMQHWKNMSSDGKYEVTAVLPRADKAKKTITDYDKNIMVNGEGKVLVGYITVQAKKDGTNFLQVLAKAVCEGYRAGGFAFKVVSSNAKEVAVSSVTNISLGMAVSGNGNNTGGSISSGPGYAKSQSQKELLPYITILVTK